MLSRSQTAINCAKSYCHTPGISWLRPMRPLPIAATFIRLLGANLPNTEAGTMEGKPNNAEALIVVLKNSRRDCWFFFDIIIILKLFCSLHYCFFYFLYG